VTGTALAEFLRQLESGNDRQPRLDLPTGSLTPHRRAPHIAPPAPELDRAYELSVPGALKLPHGVLRIDQQEGEAQSVEGMSLPVHLVLPVTVTFVTELDPPADILKAGHRRSVRTLMREAGVPPWLRDSVPLVCDQLGIACICGVAGRDPMPESAGPGTESRLFSVRWTAEVH